MHSAHECSCIVPMTDFLVLHCVCPCRHFVLAKGELRYYAQEGGAIKGTVNLNGNVVNLISKEECGKRNFAPNICQWLIHFLMGPSVSVQGANFVFSCCAPVARLCCKQRITWTAWSGQRACIVPSQSQTGVGIFWAR
jgi:hypothetical protein